MEIKVDDYKDLVKDNIWSLAINEAIKNMKDNDTLVFSDNKTYLSGTIFLKSNINIYLGNNTLLKACDDISKFNLLNDNIKKLDHNTFINCDYDGKPKLYFIYGVDLENINIDGNGIIDGNEKIFYGQIEENFIEGSFYPRMPLIFLENVKNFKITNITLQNSAFWTLHLVGCQFGLISKLKILNNLKMLNADGIDPDHSHDIIIKDCYIRSADDCVVLKGTKANIKYGDTYNIDVSNCILESTSAALKIGTETFNDFYNIHFKNIEITWANRGISIQHRDSGNIHDINFDNINIHSHLVDPKAFWGKGEVIAITSIKRENDLELGTIKDINFNNIKAIGEHGVFIYGTDNIENISFNNTQIKLDRFTNYNCNLFDLRPGVVGLIDGKAIDYYIFGAKNIKH